MGGGGLLNGRGGGGLQVKFYPYEKGGGTSFSQAKEGGGTQKVLG